MKFLIFIVAVAILAIIFLTAPKPKIVATSDIPASGKTWNPSLGKDPAESLKALADTFPNKFGETPLSVLAYSVKKPDSPAAPTVAIITFKQGWTGNFRGQFQFEWRQNSWIFSKLTNAQTGVDYTQLPEGVEMLTAHPMKEFIERYMEDGGFAIEDLARQNAEKARTKPPR